MGQGRGRSSQHPCMYGPRHHSHGEPSRPAPAPQPARRGQMQRAFEEPAFALAVGELSGPVSSDSGIHLILRTA